MTGASLVESERSMHLPCKFFVMVLWSGASERSTVPKELINRIESIITLTDVTSRREECPDAPTAYFEELGGDLLSLVLVIEHLWEPAYLLELKKALMFVERDTSIDGKRRFNLNPGYVDTTKVVVASAKKYYSRIYLGEGIFGEIELYFKDSSFHDFHFTFPEYSSPERLEFFCKLREMYLAELKLKFPL